MSTVLCLSCNGEYQTEMPDGTKYYHVCPDEFKSPARRNENVPSTAEGNTGKMKSAGAGIKVAR